ncbi:MAG: hypothetical protein AB9872_14320 [Solidesulfovibrio sp.]
MNDTRRGLRDIRTLSGRVGKVNAPHNAFMRISHIELEKVRRNREKEAASRLIADIDERLEEIEVEKAEILRNLENGHFETEGAPRRDRPPEGFKVRY